MSNYNEGARGRARYWMERAKRAEAECESFRDSLNAAVELHGECEQRCRTLEAECQRMRDALNDHHQWARTHGHEMGLGYLNSWLDIKTREALATPPPEINQVQRGVVQGANGPTWYEKPPSPPEGETEKNTARHMDEQLGWADYSWSNEPHTQQAHGDALVDEIAPPIPPFNSEAEEEEYHCEAAVRHYSERVREKLRRHLTASGVPDGYKLVPVEPTIEMTVAGGQEGAIADVYRAMIAAAPTNGRD